MVWTTGIFQLSTQGTVERVCENPSSSKFSWSQVEEELEVREGECEVGCITFVYARIDCHSQNPEHHPLRCLSHILMYIHIITYYWKNGREITFVMIAFLELFGSDISRC